MSIGWAGACSNHGGEGTEPADDQPAAPTVEAGDQQVLAEYYRKLGVAESVTSCQLAALAELGVTALDQLESDQELGAAAAEEFDSCVEQSND